MLRWGIIGTGFISHAMLKAIAQSDVSSVSMICGRNLDALADFQTQYDISETTTDMAKLCASDTVDVIYIGRVAQINLSAERALF